MLIVTKKCGRYSDNLNVEEFKSLDSLLKQLYKGRNKDILEARLQNIKGILKLKEIEKILNEDIGHPFKTQDYYLVSTVYNWRYKRV